MSAASSSASTLTSRSPAAAAVSEIASGDRRRRVQPGPIASVTRSQAIQLPMTTLLGAGGRTGTKPPPRQRARDRLRPPESPPAPPGGASRRGQHDRPRHRGSPPIARRWPAPLSLARRQAASHIDPEIWRAPAPRPARTSLVQGRSVGALRRCHRAVRPTTRGCAACRRRA